MLKQLYSAALITILLLSCAKGNGIQVKNVTIKDSVVTESGGQAYLEINYPILVGHDSTTEKINKHILSFVPNFLADYNPENVNNSNLKNLISNYFNDYKNFITEFPETSQEWAIEIASKTTISEKFISVKYNSYYYTGGAHPNSFVTFQNFDRVTGDTLSLANIFTAEQLKNITSLAEVTFRKQKQISPEESLDSAGYWFENNKFYLPQNWGITDTSLILFFNPYEISSYAEGFTELEIKITK